MNDVAGGENVSADDKAPSENNGSTSVEGAGQDAGDYGRDEAQSVHIPPIAVVPMQVPIPVPVPVPLQVPGVPLVVPGMNMLQAPMGDHAAFYANAMPGGSFTPGGYQHPQTNYRGKGAYKGGRGRGRRRQGGPHDTRDHGNRGSLYKTELCRKFIQTNTCRYGAKCQFAHGQDELRGLMRHPLYKTAKCVTFHTKGSCPYGSRCRFIHDENETELEDVARGSQDLNTQVPTNELPKVAEHVLAEPQFGENDLSGDQQQPFVAQVDYPQMATNASYNANVYTRYPVYGQQTMPDMSQQTIPFSQTGMMAPVYAQGGSWVGSDVLGASNAGNETGFSSYAHSQSFGSSYSNNPSGVVEVPKTATEVSAVKAEDAKRSATSAESDAGDEVEEASADAKTDAAVDSPHSGASGAKSPSFATARKLSPSERSSSTGGRLDFFKSMSNLNLERSTSSS